MHHNVGSTERIIRLAVGAAAGAAALNAPRGWQKAALGAIATSGLATGLTRYCPINAAIGREAANEWLSPLEEGRENTEIRRETQTSAAMGQPPGSAGYSHATLGRETGEI